ncbi:diol dehydratase small subunit [Levilactobacillus angrenensis]|uniref:Diol dehydratase small subunit n=1 Tax=Levilactobacillus angrenensis TaxID=2486020 RepID=A0ABW1UE64_9LACO|nr:diol dehydratase small subunit [Levilactobacillus angrenensis]
MSSEVDDLVAKIMSELNGNGGTATQAPSTDSGKDDPDLTAQDFPLFKKHPDLVKSPSGKPLKEISFQDIVDGKVDSKELRIAPSTLRMQGKIASEAGRSQIQNNFQRAAELTVVPDDRLLEMYGALRPYRSSKQDLLDIADELENKYHAPICSNWFKEAATNYEKHKKLKGDN